MLFTTEAHQGTDRRGKAYPYIIHPMEAVSIVASLTNDPEMFAAAMLHDTVEDTVVAIGDKLSNIRALAADYKVLGDQLWNRFHAPNGKTDIAWYFRSLAEALSELSGTAPYQEFVSLLCQLFGPTTVPTFSLT